jgi:hypothetical protein
MGKIVVSSMMSLDGYTEGSGGVVSQMPMDLAFAEHNADRVRSAGRLLFGAASYVGMMQYWPNQVDSEDAIPEDRYIASRYASDLGITVISDTLTRHDVHVWADRTEIVPRTRPASTSERYAGPKRATSSSSAVAPSGRTCLRTVWWTNCTCSSGRKSWRAMPTLSPAFRRSN